MTWGSHETSVVTEYVGALLITSAIVAGIVCLATIGKGCNDSDNEAMNKLNALRPAQIAACKTACGERGVHTVYDGDCECK